MTAPFPFSLTGGPYYEGRLFEGSVDKGAVTLAWVSKFFRRADARDRHAGGSRSAGAGARWRRRHGVLRHGLREDRLAAQWSAGPAQRPRSRRSRRDQLLELSPDLHALMTDRPQSGDEPRHRVARAHDRRAREAGLLARHHVRPDRTSRAKAARASPTTAIRRPIRRTSGRPPTRSSATCRARSCAARPTS